MATRWVALLRGIAPMHENQKNVQLRGVLEALGLGDVQSVLSSGNLLFTADGEREELQDRIEAAWPDQLGFTSRTILRRCDEIASLVARQPFGDREHGPASYLLVTFARGRVPTDDLPEPPEDAPFRLLGSTGRELFTVTDTTLGRAGTPDTMQWLERTFGGDISSRTWLTCQRVLAKC